MDDYISKPVNPDELFKAIEKQLSISEMNKSHSKAHHSI
jgi:DNA-binding response OmpR family regulator